MGKEAISELPFQKLAPLKNTEDNPTPWPWHLIKKSKLPYIIYYSKLKIFNYAKIQILKDSTKKYSNQIAF